MIVVSTEYICIIRRQRSTAGSWPLANLITEYISSTFRPSTEHKQAAMSTVYMEVHHVQRICILICVSFTVHLPVSLGKMCACAGFRK